MSAVSVRTIQEKHRRIVQGEAPRVVDLFSGCGGISIGFGLAGNEIIAGFDKDTSAMESWWFNHREGPRRTNQIYQSIDLTSMSPQEAFSLYGLEDELNRVDILVGGPPCQAYSKAGRSKLRALAQDEEAHLNDDRGSLWERFIYFVRELAPVAIFLENVPDSLSYGRVNIPEQICLKLQEMGYFSQYSLLNAAEYGVPQSRERVLVMAVHDRIYDGHALFPTATHHLPYYKEMQESGRSRMKKIVKEGMDPFATIPPVTSEKYPEAITAEQALGDLPIMETLKPDGSLLPHSKSRRVEHVLDYGHDCQNRYQSLMRSWPGFETIDFGKVCGNILRYTPRDFPIFQEMKGGDDYRAASTIADHRLKEAIQERRKSLPKGMDLTLDEFKRLEKAIVPPYDRGKFFSKWTKLRADRPAHTVVAHLKNDTYSHIHYDSRQARGISVREAARLQSFPDGFRFFGPLGDVFAQIGNAVPPLLAYHVATSMMNAIGSKPRQGRTLS